MKKYKHITGEIAIEVPENGLLARYRVNHGFIAASLIENTTDWILEEDYVKKYSINDIEKILHNISVWFWGKKVPSEVRELEKALLRGLKETTK